MSALSRDEVAHLTQLARIEASDAELDQLARQLAVIVDAVARVGEISAVDAPLGPPIAPLTNVTRPDTPVPSLTPEQALAGAPASQQQRFRVPRILEDLS